MRRPFCLFASFVLALASSACGDDASGGDGGDAMTLDAAHDMFVDGGFIVDMGPPRRPCTSAADCVDRVDCTRDTCDAEGFCRNVIDLVVCDDGVFCNGIEQCDTIRGCVAGPPEACNDDDVCTLDRCDETARMCQHMPRDLDTDGDPDWHCAMGGDCDDLDPSVSSHSPELCGDGLDNDCDGVTDEMAGVDAGVGHDVGGCGAPPHDMCDDPLDVTGGGTFPLSTAGVTPDYSFPCIGSAYRDIVLSFTLTTAQDVTIQGDPTMTIAEAVLQRGGCGSATPTLKCNTGYPALVRERNLMPGTYYVIIGSPTFLSGGDDIVVTVTFAPPTTPPTNESCAAPQDVTGGAHVAGNFVDVTNDVSIPCNAGSNPDLVYSFTTTALQDVQIRGTTPTGDVLNVCVRSTCSGGGEVRCTGGQPLATTIHELPAGDWFLVLEGPSYREVDFTMDVTFSAPTPAPPGDTCADPITLVAGTPTAGTLGDKQDDIVTTCGYNYDDAVYTFTLAAPADVNVAVDSGTRYYDVSLRSTCNTTSSELACVGGAPPSARHRNLAAGTYYAIVEAPFGGAFTIDLTATSPPVVPVAVSGNDACGMAHEIPATGGVFTGDTSATIHDYDIPSCSGFSRDVAYHFATTAAKHVTIHTDGSSFEPVVALYRGPTCTTPLYCANDFGSGSAHDALLDEPTLPAGDWFVVLSGFSSFSTGTYILDVTITDP